MQTLILAATYEVADNSAGVSVPLPLVDVGDEPQLTVLVRRTLDIEGMDKVVVVTNAFAHPQLVRWHAGLDPKLSQAVQVVSDRTATPEARLGAVGDLLFAIETAGINDDLLVIGGDNWFTYSLSDFLAEARGRSPAVVLTRYHTSFRQSRFGMAQVGNDGRIVHFVEKPSGTSMDLKASCVYFFARTDLKWFRSFSRDQSTRCSPGTFLQWLVTQTPVYGIEMHAASYDIGKPPVSGPDLLAMRAILRSASLPAGATWDRRALRKLDRVVSSPEDLMEAANDRNDPNLRIVAARLMGDRGLADILDEQGLEGLKATLISLLDDPTQNQVACEDSQDDDSSMFYVSATAAESLAHLDYALDFQAVFQRARNEGHPVKETQNKP